ncbi:hypothetical protein J6590_011099 [Homalodisca vitripennis]|nr:hypothetical protein J6590_011099 [Homalodisca vitripennis]
MPTIGNYKGQRKIVCTSFLPNYELPFLGCGPEPGTRGESGDVWLVQGPPLELAEPVPVSSHQARRSSAETTPTPLFGASK